MISCDGLKIWRPPHFPDVEIHRGREQAATMPRHVHEEVQIGAYEGGLRRFRIGGRDFDAGVGGVVAIPSGEPHASATLAGGSSTFHVMYIGAARMSDAAGDIGCAIELAPFTGASPLYWRVLALAYAFAHGTPLEQEALLLDVMLGLIRRASRPLRARGEPYAIELAKQYLHEHYADPVTLDELAHQVGLNKHYLVRAFRKAMGVPPHAYQMQLRVARAKPLLVAGQSVSAVAAALSFADQSHFVRMFQRYVGIAPGRYQKQLVAASRTVAG